MNDDKKRNVSQKSEKYVNELNHFYNRFDCLDFSQEHEQTSNMLAAASAQEDEDQCPRTNEEVRRVFGKTNPTEGASPERIIPRILKTCADHLVYIFSMTFN